MSEGVVSEFKYLTSEKADIYRMILSYIFEQQIERLVPSVYPEKIFVHMKEVKKKVGYTEDELYRDLDQLVNWGSLDRIQETGRFRTIEEFKKKKFLYQLKPKAIEIERMLGNVLLMGEGKQGSLDPMLFERLFQRMVKLTKKEQGIYLIQQQKPEEVRLLWLDIHDDFKKLRDNASDYFNRLKSRDVEEKMKILDYLQFKEAVTEYLRNFMTRLQKTSMQMERLVEDVDRGFMTIVAEKLMEYERTIPRMDEQVPTMKGMLHEVERQWDTIQGWFLGNETYESYIELLQKRTNDTISWMIRYVQRQGEMLQQHKSRRHDYLHLANWFANASTMEDAHEISACVFGMPRARHLLVQDVKETEAIDCEVWSLSPSYQSIRGTREMTDRVKPMASVDQSQKKYESMLEILREREEERKVLESLIINQEIRLRELDEILPVVRRSLLKWIGKATANPKEGGKTETGRKYKLVRESEDQIQVRCTDGVLMLPDFIILFE